MLRQWKKILKYSNIAIKCSTILKVILKQNLLLFHIIILHLHYITFYPLLENVSPGLHDRTRPVWPVRAGVCLCVRISPPPIGPGRQRSGQTPIKAKRDRPSLRLSRDLAATRNGGSGLPCCNPGSKPRELRVRRNTKLKSCCCCCCHRSKIRFLQPGPGMSRVVLALTVGVWIMEEQTPKRRQNERNAREKC